MSDEQDKEALLVDQKDALNVYFDSLLLSDEPALAEQSKPIAVVDKLQEAKDFLQASKQRQEKQDTQAAPQVKQKTQPSAESKPVHRTAKIIATDPVSPEKQGTQAAPQIKHQTQPSVESKPVHRTAKTITADPVSPKPRPSVKPEKSYPNNKLSSSSTRSGSKIVFSIKNDDGITSEQVLIPRSQRLAAAQRTNPAQSIARSMPQINKSEPVAGVADKPLLNKKPLAEQEPAIKTAPLEKKNSSLIKTSTVAQEAPSLDLSLFLPKIKKLSEDEIAQQIEALTQAAVSQAQLESDLAHVAELQQVSQKILKTQSEPGGLVRNIDNAPAWAVPDFQVLLFTIAGLKLAVPLAELNGIVEWRDEYITELPGHKSWYLGIIQNQGKNVPVIDTLQQVVPENRWPENYLNERQFKHIIIIDNARWGLACETVLEVITLKTDSVKWRSSRTRRRWLLGTVIEYMCALLDGSEFAAMLKTGDDSLLSP